MTDLAIDFIASEKFCAPVIASVNEFVKVDIDPLTKESMLLLRSNMVGLTLAAASLNKSIPCHKGVNN